MKKIIIGDLHLGIKDSNGNFINYQNSFFNEILIPYLQKRPKEFDLVFLGDVFHNRRILNVKTIAQINQLFSKLSELCNDIIVIVGNHDLYFRNSYDLSASHLILNELFSNITMFNDYHIENNNLYVNWRNNRKEYIELFETIPFHVRENINYVFGHFELFNYKFNANINNDDVEALSESDLMDYFPKALKILSGHYHTPQEKKKVRYVGVPYQLTWSEYNERLGFIKLENDSEELIENPFQIFQYYEFNSKEDIDGFQIDEGKFKKIIKVKFNDESLKDKIEILKDNLSEQGHDVVIVNTFNNMIANCNETEIQKNLSMENLLWKYLNEETTIPNKNSFYKLFMQIYENIKNEMGNNIELF